MAENRIVGRHRVASGAAVALLFLTGTCGIASAGAATVPTGASSLNADQAYVASAYQDFLGRNPHGVEWDAIQDDFSTPSSRGAFVGDLATSPEWVTKTVQNLYRNTLGRDGDQGGVAYWVSMIRTNQRSVATVAASMYSSPEYFNGYGHANVRTWVLDLYSKILLRDGNADPSGVTYWTSRAAKSGRTDVAYAFFQSNESRHTRVKGLYETLLGRSPVGDKAGWDYWANVITTKGDLALASSLAASNEYYARAGVRFAHAGPGTWALLAVGGDDSLIGGIVLGPDEVGNGSIVCTLPCTQPTQLTGLTGYTDVKALGATSGGIIVGSAASPDGHFVGLVWANAAATPTLLPSPNGSTDVLVSAVGTSGVVVGSAVDATGRELAYYWTSPSAQPTALTPPVGVLGSWAQGISPSGVIFGGAVSGDLTTGAVTVSGLVWPTTVDPPTTLLAPGGDGEVQISAMSASGEIIGFGEASAGLYQGLQGLLWTSPTASPTLIAKPAGSGAALPLAISPSGSIIGVSYLASDSNYERPMPVGWATSSTNPNTLAIPAGYTGGLAIGFLSSGRIAGSGVDANGDGHVLVWDLLTATPTVLPDVS